MSDLQISPSGSPLSRLVFRAEAYLGAWMLEGSEWRLFSKTGGAPIARAAHESQLLAAARSTFAA